MNIVTFVNGLGIGGTEKAACRWARGLADLGHEVHVLSLADGPRRAELEASNIGVRVAGDRISLLQQFSELRPDVIHAHAPGHPNRGDILGGVLASLPKIPVVQTNVFGQLNNPREIRGWTSVYSSPGQPLCRRHDDRSGRWDENFFRRASVAVYPLDPDDGPAPREIVSFREKHGVAANEVLFGRISARNLTSGWICPLKPFALPVGTTRA